MKSESKMSHPLFDRWMNEGPAEETYITDYTPDKHWVLDEHRFMGKAILPGTAYLEMARAAFANHLFSLSGKPAVNAGQIEIRDVGFAFPLILEDGETREVRTVLKKLEDIYNLPSEMYAFFVVSQSEEGNWQEHARGELRSIAESSDRHEIRTLEAECGKEIIRITENGTGEITEFEKRLRLYGPRWLNLKWAKFGKDQGLAMLELPESYTDDIGYYKLHPALLDIAAGFMYIRDKQGCLPFSYRSVKINGDLPEKIYSYARYAEFSRPGMFKYDITIMDETGISLAEIRDYVLKEVRTDTPAYKQIQDDDDEMEEGEI